MIFLAHWQTLFDLDDGVIRRFGAPIIILDYYARLYTLQA